MIIACKFRLLFCITILVCVLSAVAGLLICPKCGYENEETDTECVHCKAKLPTRSVPVETAEKPESTPDTSKDDSWYLPVEIVDKEIKLGKKNLDAGDVVVARLLFKNAVALNRITDPEIENKWPEMLRKAIGKCDMSLCRVVGECPLCKGTGSRIVQSVGIQGDPLFQTSLGKSCPMCNGSGKVRKWAEQDDLKPVLGAGAKRYTMIQQGRKYVAVGEAWLPMDLEEKLSIRQTVLIKKAAAHPCEECLGFCVVACPICKGVGSVKCPKCENGMIKNKAAEKNDKIKRLGSNAEQLAKCPDCHGTSMITCLKCQGDGRVMCERCNGTGEQPTCKKCDGRGLISCKKCLGSGKFKDAVCPACRGEGVALCSSCNGDGVRN